MIKRNVRPTAPCDDGIDWHAPWAGRQIPPVDHAESFRLMSQLSETCHAWIFKKGRAITPEQVIEVLNKAGVSFVLMGLYGMSGWMLEERATKDVDVLVRKSHHRKAVQAIQAAFPHLEMRDTPAVTRFIEPGGDRVVVDLMKPEHELHQQVFNQSIPVGDTHRVPDLEMALATKFAAMVSPARLRMRKLQDVVDFSSMVQRNKDKIDRDKLRTFGELTYAGGGNEIIEFLDKIIADKPIEL